MTDRSLPLTYRDVHTVLALVDTWRDGRVRFAKGAMSVDAVIDGETRPSLPIASRFIVRSPAVGIFEPAASAAIGTPVENADNIGVVIAPGRKTPVPADATGTLSERLVEPGTFVEYGQAVAAISVPSE